VTTLLRNLNLFNSCSVLQTGVEGSELEATIVACLDRIFRTKYGASLLLQYAVCIISFPLTQCARASCCFLLSQT